MLKKPFYEQFRFTVVVKFKYRFEIQFFLHIKHKN